MVPAGGSANFVAKPGGVSSPGNSFPAESLSETIVARPFHSLGVSIATHTGVSSRAWVPARTVNLNFTESPALAVAGIIQANAINAANRKQRARLVMRKPKRERVGRDSLRREPESRGCSNAQNTSRRERSQLFRDNFPHAHSAPKAPVLHSPSVRSKPGSTLGFVGMALNRHSKLP